jgi:NAD(P)H-hydrate repair Nnr-like enzyme with NAD(P)H-hydrate dehydratase domain
MGSWSAPVLDPFFQQLGIEIGDWRVAADHDRKKPARSRRPRRSFAATGGTIDALDGIITALRAAGYEFVIPKS